eukprot:GGOE01036557.1.p1 GENE.GGOE01036557.1~~GGOE01036557.1.p1  ORF type:complete len:511 (+),score=105.41 GGOE01036557.1:70-1533(+)
MEKQNPIICPYLDTIDRASLDFDFEKLCSVMLTDLNVYGCLVCGKYFKGRAKGSPAFNHSLSSGHHVFLNLDTAVVYCLPDLYEVRDASLADIKYNLNPTYTHEQIDEILSRTKSCRGLDGKEFRAGLVGLNNLKLTDYFSAVVQLLVRIPELCRYYMSPFEYSRVQVLTKRYGELIRKMWNPRAFKGQVSPHDLMQAITSKSEKKFQIGQPGDPMEFLQFLLTALHEEEIKGYKQWSGGKRKSKQHTSIIHETFQGRVRVTTQEVMITDDGQGNKVETHVGEPQVKEVPFLFLQFDLPDTPLFKDESERNIIPQVPLFTLLHKYDGQQVTYQTIHGKTTLAKKVQYIITKLPRYLIFCYKRFKMNYWFEEKNKTIINFPVKSLDMREFCEPDAVSCVKNTKYDLLGNLCHDGSSRELGNGYFTHVYLKTTGDWWMVHDLEIKSAEAQEISCTAPYIQIWESQDCSHVDGTGVSAPPKVTATTNQSA